jgi:DNA-binding response OmpR family regulator
MDTKIRILLIGGNPDFFQNIRQTLASHDYQVKTALDENDAIMLATQFNPDLIIIDLDFADAMINCYAICIKLRIVSMCPIIALSGSNEEAIEISAVNSYIDFFVHKPLTMSLLLAVVKSSLRLWLKINEAKKYEIGQSAAEAGETI